MLTKGFLFRIEILGYFNEVLIIASTSSAILYIRGFIIYTTIGISRATSDDISTPLLIL